MTLLLFFRKVLKCKMEIFNVREVAQYLNCSESSIRNLVRANMIPYFRIGKKLNFNKEAIDMWIYNQEMKNFHLK